MGAMTTEEITAYLAQPLVANLVTLRPSGAPHIAPVWFAFTNSNFYIYTSRNSQRARNLQRDNRAAISIPTCAEPYSYVLAEGTATTTRNNVAHIGRAIAERYIGPDDPNKTDQIDQFMAETLDDNTIIIELIPHRIMSWSETSEDA